MRKSNAIRDFLDRYAGRDTSKKITEKVVADMMRDYEIAYDRVLGKLARARRYMQAAQISSM